MAFHVVHADSRHIPTHRQTAPNGSTHQQSPDKPRASREGHPLDFGLLQSSLIDYLPHQGHGFSNMVAGCQFRDNTAVFGVQVDLAVQAIRQQAFFAVINSHSGFVAGRFNT